ncbi:MAG: hypothetical protein QHH10_07375 [Peptococcaceae bacterium]|nr:hypothetical protein [Peptococcaceae bacterium]MDH7525120.1 hypothetical protein [Peptococcaceae bacterium]
MKAVTEKRKGLVMETSPQGYITVMTPQGEFQRVPWSRSSFPQVGSEVEYCLPAAGKRVYAWKFFAALAASFVLFVLLIPAMPGLLLTGPQQVVAYIGVDINPSLELGLNSRGRVLEALGLNEEGASLLQKVNIIGVPVQQAVETVAREAVKEKYLAPGKENIVLITASSEKGLPDGAGNLEQRVIEVLEEKNIPAQVETIEISAEIRAAARSKGVSPGKYVIMMEALEEGMEISIEDIRENGIARAVREAGGVPGQLVSKVRQDRDKLREMQEKFEEKQKKLQEEAKERRTETVKQPEEQHRGTEKKVEGKKAENGNGKQSEDNNSSKQNDSGGGSNGGKK